MLMFDDSRKNQLRSAVQHLVDPESSDSAVLIALTAGKDGKIILTQRAGHMQSHAGEVAFPGGWREPDDPSLAHTALRETEEEIGLPMAAVEVVCALPQVTTRHRVTVTPFFGLAPEQPALVPNPEELDAVFCVPVEWLLDAANLVVDEYDLAEGKRYVPSFIFDDFRIWGITAIMLFDFLNLTFAAGLQLPRTNTD